MKRAACSVIVSAGLTGLVGRAGFIGLGGLVGCAVGPHYSAPDTPMPQKYANLPADNRAAPLSQPQATDTDLSKWWTQFNDPTLDRLVARALESNLDLQSAASRIRQAREQVIIAGAARLPSVSSSALAARLHANSNPLAALAGGQSSGSAGGSPSAGAQSGSTSSGTTLDLYTLGFDATWELDVFGGTEHGVEAARASAEATMWQMRDAQVTLTAEVANAYLSLRTTQARSAILRESARHQEDLLKFASARARNGFITELDVNQQRAQLAATRAAIPSLEADERAQVHALSVLLGESPESLLGELSTVAAVPSVPTVLPVGLPSELLRRRPDVRRAERQLASQTAEVGVAVANLYPKFNLLGAVSLASTSPGRLFDSSSLAEVGGGMISWPIFQGGKVRANIRSTQEQRQQAYLAYRKAVLVALHDTEDALVRYTSEQRRLLSLRQSEEAATSSQHIAEAQYRNGLVTFINVLTATTTQLSAQDQVEQSTQALAQDLVSLYKALGGGWTSAPSP